MNWILSIFILSINNTIITITVINLLLLVLLSLIQPVLRVFTSTIIINITINIIGGFISITIPIISMIDNKIMIIIIIL